ncbi:MAG TPA: tRNA dihydrouridine(20/20a) synthase DusA [Hyphomonadaceae bacterium]|jgi:tRNA-dihydrouridine synthase A|nr:tRNA dihydrouridine(20/20a) synthase DusA [Hyphomonadaceae bacterium]
MKNQSHRFSVAPMMDWTDRNCRAFHRHMTRHALLYTEMVTADAIMHGDRERLLGFDPLEQPVALQLGGSEPEKLARAARIGAEQGYVEINLNVGCPSERVQSGAFGACLMREPELVAECLAAMREAVSVPVTVKHRLGVDDDDPRERLFSFVEKLSKAGTTTFIVHARKAWLKGLSPKENRELPPLDYAIVAELKRARPDLEIILNGGIANLDVAQRELAPREGTKLDGVMLGRAAYHDPAILLDVDRRFFGDTAPTRTADEAARDFRPWIEKRLGEGVPLHPITRHMLGLFAGRPGARQWRRVLSEKAPGARGLGAIAIYDEALAAVRPMALVS